MQPASDSATGILVLVVGPSGAGKDSLINAARVAFADDHRFAFARRTVTRDSSSWEEHDSLNAEAFAAAAAAGRFALAWTAHGLNYGIGAELVDHLTAGRVVICNVSRSIIAEARARFPRVHVVLIDADPAILATRLTARGREPEAVSRAGQGRPVVDPAACETHIDNSGALADASAAFIAKLREIAKTVTA